MRVTVVGAGIVGLACALRLSEAGHRVSVVAAARGSATTSSVAAALWYPYRAHPERAVTRWAALGYAALAGLVEGPAGVRMRTGTELLREVSPDPWWRDAVPTLDRVPAAELPEGYADGWTLTVPVVDTGVHLAWLEETLAARGVRVAGQRVGSLDELSGDVVVDCAGLGARELAGDHSVQAVRGQVVVVEQVGLTRWLLDQSDPLTYVVPRLQTIVLGGSADEGDEDRDVRPVTAEAVRARAVALVPALAGARVLAHQVGLRPARPAVRVERVDAGARPVVHCYGHGGAGVTLAYGCAEDVVTLVG